VVFCVITCGILCDNTWYFVNSTCYHTKYHVLSHKIPRVITQNTTCYHTKYHVLTHKIPRVITQHTTCYHTKYHVLSHKIPHVITQNTTCYHTKYHMLSHKIPHVITQNTTCYHTKYVCLYMYFSWRFDYQEGRVGVQFTDLTPPHYFHSHTEVHVH
jgi:recombinational DNA repair protein RecR